MSGGSFFGLNVALQGLFTSQRSLDTVNHNLNNVNTPGYSRQQVVQQACRPIALVDGTGMLGTGAEVTGVKRIRDEFLDFKYWSENISMGEWGAKQEVLSDIEVAFNEPSDSGFTTIMSDFYDAMQELTKDASSEAARTLVRERGVTLATYFNSLATHFEELQMDVNNRIQTKVDEANSYAVQIQQLNKQIYLSELDGNTANDMRDQRTLLVDKLSKIVNIEAYEVVTGKLPNGQDDKHFVVAISGKAIVDHFSISKLAVVQRDAAHKVNDEDVDNLYDVKWADGNSLDIKGGELRGFLDTRDGNDGSNDGSNGITSPKYKGIPYYQRKLNEFVRVFARAFNEGYIDANNDNGFDLGEENGIGHADGYGVDQTEKGYRFFTMLDGKQSISSADFLDEAGLSLDAPDPTDPSYPAYMEKVYHLYDNITAKNFAVSDDILKDINKISTSDSNTPTQEENTNALKSLLDMRQNANMFSEGAPEDFMKATIASMGIDAQQAMNYEANQQVVINQIIKRRLSDSGVSLDEEMTNLVKFQQAYSSSAKMIQTMNEVYDTLINRLFV